MKLKPVVPFEPVSAAELPTGDKWLAQIKWDGVRMLTYWDGSEARLVNRRGNDRSVQYPEFITPHSYCSASSFILDGEFVALADGVPSFFEIMKRDSLRNPRAIERAIDITPVTYMIFDILFADGEWVNGKPLYQRQQLLQSVIAPTPNVQLVQSTPDLPLLFEVAKQHALEGIVCKNMNSTYPLGGKDGRWVKRKLFHDLIAVVGGVTYRGNVVNALLLGLYVEDQLMYIGHAGTGKLRGADWQAITNAVQPLLIAHKPFANEPERSKDAFWVNPLLTVKVQFLEWTPRRTMRHPSIQAVVHVPHRQCVFPDPEHE